MAPIVGIVLLFVVAGMIVVAKPRGGQDRAPFLSTWAITQAYILTMLALVLVGAGLVIRGFIA